MEVKNCLECNMLIRGRADKRFCDDACRNNYNNRLNSDTNNITRNINNSLRKNRRILQDQLAEESTVKIPQELLLQKGFDFKYHTHQLQTNKGQIYRFVYEFGYLPLESNLYLIVREKC